MSSSGKRGQHPWHAVMRTRAWWGGYWVNPLFVCRGKAVSAPAAPRFCELRQHSTAVSSGLDEKGHLMILRCQLPHPFTPERSRPLFLLPPASCLQAQSPRFHRLWVLLDPGRPVLLVGLEACPREPGTNPQGLSLLGAVTSNSVVGEMSLAGNLWKTAC